MADESVLHLRGPVLVGPDEILPQAWVLGGRVTFERPTTVADRVQSVDGWVLPGLVDAHCHIGLGAAGAVAVGVMPCWGVVVAVGCLLIRTRSKSPVGVNATAMRFLELVQIVPSPETATDVGAISCVSAVVPHP